ncbi:inactive serine protease PAMR1 isoform X1 [Latimeria chalumnae]|uniref:inactive serine protease PAMR1 isoform X1 n=1 Tax=Latimeria chalumnae TaxID=7897 RepID=UPI0006D910B5|nr:PREDICTED: inactive serine protease PAMR1 isoform X2 [Latimeria chalumnae]|eukprot:XP_014347499.1 PREDICTED: inactive serine protease PAMR1 isoform X2 [Latimeria chalumnae]
MFETGACLPVRSCHKSHTSNSEKLPARIQNRQIGALAGMGWTHYTALLLNFYQVLLMIPAMPQEYSVVNENCPGAEWNIMCRGCCEYDQIECVCPGKNERIGYSIPCCRNEDNECDPCLIHPGCSIFDNCKTCNNGSWGAILDDFYIKGTYCAECRGGWSGGDCLKCGGVINATKGHFFLESYPLSAHCEWTLYVTPTFTVELRFPMLSLEFDYMCQYDYLEIRDGDNVDSRLIARLCGNERPAPIRSSGSSFHILFVSDGSKNFDGFYATFEEVTACSSSPCFHDGTCILDGVDSFKCACLAGYTGKHCENMVMCRNPGAPANGIIEGEDFRFGFHISFSCNPGYTLHGSHLATCQLDGTWTPFPTCVAEDKSCKDPGVPLHGYCQLVPATPLLKEKSMATGTILRFFCNNSYVLSGSKQRSCKPDGEWTGKQPVCVKACKEPKTPELVRKKVLPMQQQARETPVHRLYSSTYNKYKFDIHPTKKPAKVLKELPPGYYHIYTQLEYDCISPLYRRIGSSKRTCLKTAKWSGRAPACIPICGKLDNFSLQRLLEMKWPWLAAIYRKINGEKNESFRKGAWFLSCSGAVLNERTVTVAAHCVTDLGKTTVLKAAEIRVVLGKYYRDDQHDEKSLQVLQVSAIIIHPNYDPVLLDSDIAIIKLLDKAKINDHVQPICLPAVDSLDVFTGDSWGFITGWKILMDEKDSSYKNDTVRVGTIQSIDSVQCEQQYEENGILVSVTENMFCAKKYPQGFSNICPAETGGIVMLPSTGKPELATWHLIGLVSWGYDRTCDQGLYTAYTKVIPFKTWIEKNMK